MILTREQLTKALRTPISTVKLLDSQGKFVTTLPATEAVPMIGSGLYQIGGSVSRVKYLREMGPRSMRVRQHIIGITDSGFSCARYPEPAGGIDKFPALARAGAGLGSSLAA